jgi:hypothetical protein
MNLQHLGHLFGFFVSQETVAQSHAKFHILLHYRRTCLLDFPIEE